MFSGIISEQQRGRCNNSAVYREVRPFVLRYDFFPFAIQECFLVRVLIGSKRGKLRAVFIPKRGFRPSAVVGKIP